MKLSDTLLFLQLFESLASKINNFLKKEFPV